MISMHWLFELGVYAIAIYVLFECTDKLLINIIGKLTDKIILACDTSYQDIITEICKNTLFK